MKEFGSGQPTAVVGLLAAPDPIQRLVIVQHLEQGGNDALDTDRLVHEHAAEKVGAPL